MTLGRLPGLRLFRAAVCAIVAQVLIVRLKTNPLAVSPLLQSPEVLTMLELLSEVLFLDNSRPLHRQLLGLLRPLPESATAALGRMLCARIVRRAARHLPPGWPAAGSSTAATGAATSATTAMEAEAKLEGDEGPESGSNRVPLGQALTSLLSAPAFRGCLAPCAAPATACVALSVRAVLSGGAAGAAADAGGEEAAALHIPPAVMEDVQDAGGLLACTWVGHRSDSPCTCQMRLSVLHLR